MRALGTRLLAIATTFGLMLSACDKIDDIKNLVDLCSGQPNCVFVPPAPEMTLAIQGALQAATPGQTIVLPKGEFKIKVELTSQNGEDLVIRGQGKDKTILDFTGQIEELGAGSGGLKIEAARNVVLEGLTIRNTAGDALTLMDSQNIVVRDVRVEWTDTDDMESHGAYGIYPIRVDGILIEHSIARGAADAGIYVGESKNIVVRNNEVTENVSGLQIENCFDSEVYGNKASDNVSGIFVFDLPGKLTQQNGGRHRIHGNHSYANNRKNFAERGQIAAAVPTGTGFVVLAAKETEIFDNIVEGNGGAGVLVASYLTLGREINDPVYYPYPATVYVHGNTFKGNGTRPLIGIDATRESSDIQTVLDDFFGNDVPELIYDGMTTTPVEGAPAGDPLHLCFKDNKLDDGTAAAFANLRVDLVDQNDILGTIGQAKESVVQDISAYACEGPTQPAIDATELESLGK